MVPAAVVTAQATPQKNATTYHAHLAGFRPKRNDRTRADIKYRRTPARLTHDRSPAVLAGK